MSYPRLWTAARALLALAMLLAAGQAASAAPALSAEQATTTLWLPMVARADAFIKQQFIGYSVGRRAMYVYRFGHGEHKRLILGGIHGGYEWNTIELVNMLMDHARANPGLIPADQTLYFLPVLNPDGEARSHWLQGRANDHNVDINRNFDFNWKPDWYRVGCWNYLPITAGTGPFSEIEAEEFRDFVLDNQVEAIISYHSSGAEIYAGGKPPDPASLDLALTLAGASGYAYPPRASTCEETGQMIDWASSQGIAAVDVELAYHQSIDFEPNQRMLEAFLNWVKP